MAVAAFHQTRSFPPPPSSTSKNKKLLLPHHDLHLPSHNNRHHSPNDTLLLTTTSNSNKPPSVTTTTTTSPDSFHKKLEFLETELGLDPYRALSLNPELRSLPLHRLRLLRSVLLSFGLDVPHDSSRILLKQPHLLTSDPNLHLLPSLRFLRHTVPLPRPGDVRLAIVRCPRLLVTPVERQLLPALHFLRRLGFHPITPAITILLVSSVEETLIAKLDYLRSLGFSYREAVHMVRRNPALFTYNIDCNFRPKVEFLLGEMGRAIEEVRDFPQYFSFSLEGRIKPRHRMLVERGLSMTLAKMLRPSNGEFEGRLVEMMLRSLEERRRLL